MMLRGVLVGWVEAADAIIAAMDKAIGAKRVTYDFARLMPGATEVKCSEFADALISANVTAGRCNAVLKAAKWRVAGALLSPVALIAPASHASGRGITARAGINPRKQRS